MYIRLRSEALKATKIENLGRHPPLKPDKEQMEGMLCTYLIVMQYCLVAAKFAVLCSCRHPFGVTRVIVPTMKYMYIYIIYEYSSCQYLKNTHHSICYIYRCLSF